MLHITHSLLPVQHHFLLMFVFNKSPILLWVQWSHLSNWAKQLLCYSRWIHWLLSFPLVQYYCLFTSCEIVIIWLLFLIAPSYNSNQVVSVLNFFLKIHTLKSYRYFQHRLLFMWIIIFVPVVTGFYRDILSSVLSMNCFLQASSPFPHWRCFLLRNNKNLLFVPTKYVDQLLRVSFVNELFVINTSINGFIPSPTIILPVYIHEDFLFYSLLAFLFWWPSRCNEAKALFSSNPSHTIFTPAVPNELSVFIIFSSLFVFLFYLFEI